MRRTQRTGPNNGHSQTDFAGGCRRAQHRPVTKSKQRFLENVSCCCRCRGQPHVEGCQISHH
jgi:hypothetical protein